MTVSSSYPAREHILKTVCSHAVARCLHVAAELCIADYLEKDPQSLEKLSALTHTNAKALYRLMRVLVTHGIFGYTEDQKFTLTETSKLLLSNHPQSLRTAVAKELDLRRWNALGNLEISVRSGKPAFQEVYGETFYDYIERNPDAKKRFDEGMSDYSQYEDQEIVKAFDFSIYKTIVDVGGNQGSLSAEILKSFPNSQIILFDLPGTVKNPKYLTASSTFKGHYQAVGGNFFDYIPSGGDLYILKRVLHNWNDEDALKILKNCTKNLTPVGCILIIDLVEEPLSVTTSASPFLDFDISAYYGESEQIFRRIVNRLGSCCS